MSLRVLPLLALALTSSAFAQTPPDLEKLKSEADAKVKEIGSLTSSGKLTTNDDSVRLLQQLVDELRDIRERLKALEDKSAAQGKKTDVLTQNAARLKWNGYVQMQYQDTDRVGSSQYDAFRLRRVRLALDGTASPRTGGRFSFDLGTGTNQTQEQLRDAWIWYDFSGGAKLGRDKAFAGQMAFPLGYELERSSADREMPERAQYNQLLFPTERSRGVKIRREGRDGLFQAGLFDALAINDAEQANLAPGPGNRLAGVVQGRYVKGNTSVGASAMVGERAAYTAAGATSPEVNRRFGYLDLEQRNLGVKGFTLRGEAMIGSDRLPNATASPANVDHPLSGYHLIGTYRLSSVDQLSVRWEGFDPNLDAGGNALHGYGASYVRFLTPELRVTLAHEVFVDEAREATTGQTRYGVTTLRLQVRF